MFQSTALFSLMALMLFVLATAETYYVTPKASTICPEKDVHCSTLDDYASKSTNYFTSNTTLILLPGKHSLNSKFSIKGIKLLTIAGNRIVYSDTSVTCMCNQYAVLTFEDIGVVSMKSLVLIGCTKIHITSVEEFEMEDCILESYGYQGKGLELNMITNAHIKRSVFSYAVLHTEQLSVPAVTIRHSSTVVICSCKFSNFISENGAVYSDASNVTIHISTFFNNTVRRFGGAVCAMSTSNITINNSTFINNVATRSGDYGQGGAVYTYESSIIIKSSTFANNSSPGNGPYGGATVYAEYSTVTIICSTFFNNTIIGYGFGGALHASASNVVMETTLFTNNSAINGDISGKSGGGGAVYAVISSVIINSVIFANNTVMTGEGGAVLIALSNITINNTTFINNAATGYHGSGGGFFTLGSNFTVNNTTFIENSATGQGGAMNANALDYDTVGYNATINNCTFTNNLAEGFGGTILLYNVPLNTTGFLNIQNNIADGGSLYAIHSTIRFSGNITVLNNYGSLYTYASNVTFMGHVNFVNNSPATSQEGGALTGFLSELVFFGTANFHFNGATRGGAISVTQSKVYVYGDITIAHNTASLSGGGIYAYQSELNFKKCITIKRNSVPNGEGGGIHAISSIISMTDHSNTYIVSNHATKGGGACLEMNSKLYIVKEHSEDLFEFDYPKKVRLEFIENFAEYGGALYITADTYSGTCYATPFSGKSTISSECFIQGLLLLPYSKLEFNVRNTYFMNNSASQAGDVIYGGLLDRCSVNPFAEIYYTMNVTDTLLTPSSISALTYVLNITDLNQEIFGSTKMVSSKPVRVCFCRTRAQDNQPDCSYHPPPVYVTKGEIFIVSLVAVDQVNNTISNTIIHGSLPLPASLGEEQSAQKTNQNGSCTDLKYTILSPHNQETLSLYAEGPCMDIGISKANLTVYIEPCPVGFNDTNLVRCDCDGILRDKYIISCSIGNKTVLRKNNVWFTYVNSTDHPHSYILHKHCPFDYCLPPSESVNVNLSIPNGADAMCAFNRSGKLCGSCKDGLSLSLGSSSCISCSNNWLVLIVVFVIAGIALVAFILFCNLTVAVGTINGIIFYANIIAANRATFLPYDTSNVLTAFIAWLNLDFGFETCFYDGMDGYSKTWLQLAFPLYIISLVVAIIVISDYSIKFAALFTGKDPIATLATLILLSYTKLIRTIIASLSFTILEYSDGSHELVWLTDANIPYLKGKHIPLFITALTIVVVGLTYTFLLFGWQWIVRCPNIRPFTWITKNGKLFTLLDTYQNPYNKNHRYWIGLLLLVRVLLYLVSAVNVLGDPGINLLSINSAVFLLYALQVSVLQKDKIHKTMLVHSIENVSLLNLIGFTSLTIYVTGSGNRESQNMVAYLSTAIAFVTLLVVLIYHAYMFVLKKIFQKVKYNHELHRSINLLTPDNTDILCTHDSGVEEMVSVTEINALPEPLDTDECDQLLTVTTNKSDIDETEHSFDKEQVFKPDNVHEDTPHNTLSCGHVTDTRPTSAGGCADQCSIKRIEPE